MSSLETSQLVIVAGGRGTRLKQRTGSLPKPMIDVGGKPLIEYQILLAQRHGIKNILILTGFGAEHIEHYLGDGRKWSVHIRYRREREPRGTAGAVIAAFDDLTEMFFVLYADTMLNVDLARLAAEHRAKCAGVTLLVHPNDHPQDSDLIELNDDGRVLAIHPYPHPPGRLLPNLVNAGLYVFWKSALSVNNFSERKLGYPSDFGKHLFPLLLSQNVELRGYLSREYIKDAGTPARLDSVRRDYQAGRTQHGSFETPAPAVFLDRDGTLNPDPGWIRSPEQLALLPGTAEAVQMLNRSGRLAVLITNQPVVARGECSETELKAIHNKLEWLLGQSNAYLDRIYYCPHHPEGGFQGERPDLKMKCTCRKPATGLLEAAARDMNIDKSESWLIGDNSADIDAASNFGIRSVLVRSNQRDFATLRNCQPDAQAESVLDAVRFIMARSPAAA